jgi:hypothetical protein
VNYYDLGFSKFLTKSILSDRVTSETTPSNSPGGYISSTDLSVQLNPITDIVFSSTDSNTATWTAGIIYFSNGSNSGNIVTGNTGNISAKTYVYFDGDKPGQLLMDTDIKNVFGGRKMLLAIVEEGATGKSCKITPIITTGYTGNFVAENINVSQLDAVATNTGTLTVDESITCGGSANGIVYVKDSSGNTKVQLDNNGITVNTGKIIVKNDSDTNIIDSKGLVSTANFLSANVNATPDAEYSSGTYTDITDATLSFSTPRNNTNVLFLMTILTTTVQTDTGLDMAARVFYNMKLDSTILAPEIYYDSFHVEATGIQENEYPFTFNHSVIKTVGTAGSHTVKLQYKQEGVTNAHSHVIAWGLSYVILGS